MKIGLLCAATVDPRVITRGVFGEHDRGPPWAELGEGEGVVLIGLCLDLSRN